MASGRPARRHLIATCADSHRELNEGGSALPTATTGEARTEIDAAPLAVYELVSDITRMGEWSPECYRCEWLDGARTAARGARFRGHNRLGKIHWHTDAIVTVAQPGQEFAFTTLHTNGREETFWRYQFRQLGTGTEVIEYYRFLWCPIANRIAELPIPRDKQLRRGIQQTLNRIKTAAETSRLA
jgi:Polyketide cyclase / dehydrase and lipid transport